MGVIVMCASLRALMTSSNFDAGGRRAQQARTSFSTGGTPVGSGGRRSCNPMATAAWRGGRSARDFMGDELKEEHGIREDVGRFGVAPVARDLGVQRYVPVSVVSTYECS